MLLLGLIFLYLSKILLFYSCKNELYSSIILTILGYSSVIVSIHETDPSSLFSGNICTAAGEGFSHAGIELPRYSEIYPQPMGHHIFMWRIDSYKGKSDFKITGNTFGDAPYGAIIYSICGHEPEEKIEIDNNLYK